MTLQRAEPSVRMQDLSRLSGKEKGRLLAGLAKFANLGDGVEDYINFGHQMPDFYPVTIRGAKGRYIEWEPACRKLVICYRECVRRLWRADPEAISDEQLAVLMGLQLSWLEASMDQLQEWMHIFKTLKVGDHLLMTFVPAWREVLDAYPGAFAGEPAMLSPSWRKGEFVYGPYNDFQRAVYLLFRERWRARVCLQCGGYFAAKRPPQLYCSARCFAEAKRVRDLSWRRRQRSESRKARATETRKKRGN